MLLLLRSRWDFHPVYNFHSRSSNNSFLRRGATSNSSLRKHSSQINLWCPSLQQKLPLIQSPPVPHALSNPGTPIMKSPNYSMPRCRSENLMDQSTKQKLSPSSKPILMTSSAERLSATEANTADLHRKPSNNTRHVSWGAAASTIRATYRFSHGRPRTSPALSPSSPVLHRQQSRTVMPWKWMPNTYDLSKPKYILDQRVYFVIVLDQIHLAVLWLPIISKYGYVPAYHFVSCFIGGYNENLGLGDVICIARSNKVSICYWIDTQSAKNNKSCSCQYNLHDLASSVSGQTLAQWISFPIPLYLCIKYRIPIYT